MSRGELFGIVACAADSRRLVNGSAARDVAARRISMWIVRVALDRPYTFIVLAQTRQYRMSTKTEC